MTNKELSTILTEKELKVRNWWLGMICTSALMGTANFFYQLATLNSQTQSSNSPTQLFFALLINLSSCYIPYRCAYQKPGTRWLSFCIIGGMISIPMTLLCYIFSSELRHQLLQTTNQPIAFLQLILAPLFMVGYFILSIKLKKINRKIQGEMRAAIAAKPQ